VRPPHIVNARDVEPQPKAVGDTERVRRDLGTAAGSVSCGLQHVTVAAGKIGCPPHVHSAEEEAFVVLEAGAQFAAKEIQNYCQSKLESFKVPKIVKFMDELPKTDTGKIKKTGLQ